MSPNFMDEIDCANFFDQIDDLIEFPPENECGVGDFVAPVDSKDFPSMWNDVLPESDSFFSGGHGDGPTDISTELSVPYEDIVQLEWLSTFVEDSFSGGGLTMGKENLCVNKVEPSHSHFQTSSPVSVLESSSSSTSSCSGPGKTIPVSPSHHRGAQRARSKRPRPATFNPRAAIQLISPSSSFIETPRPFVTPGFSSEPENFAESPKAAAGKKGPKPAGSEQKKKKIKISSPADPDGSHQNGPVRKCLHCEITKTPQWRAGPMGPKTLCNACGVRFKSGRLYPEYRPAASPTFVPSLHSNSHKKVIEMRCKGGPETATTAAAAPTALKPEIVTETEIVPSP